MSGAQHMDVIADSIHAKQFNPCLKEVIKKILKMLLFFIFDISMQGN